MSDLRDALETLVAEWSERTTGYDEYQELRSLLAAHPVEPAPEVVVDHRPGETCSVVASVDPETGFSRQPSDAAGEAAAEALLEAGFVDPDDGTIPQWHEENAPPWWTHPSEAVKVALEAAYRVDAPRPLLDRDAVRLAIADELDGEGVVSYGLAPKLTDRVMDVARPIPTREQIAEAMHDHWSETHRWRQGCRQDVCIDIFLDRADAVMALLDGAGS